MRKTILSLVVASILGTGVLVNSACAQAPAQPGTVYVPGGYVPSEAWRTYPPGTIWQGYTPGAAWRGYAPPVVNATPPAPVATPRPTVTYVTPTVPAGTTYYPQVATTQPAPAVRPRTTTARRVAPAHYREFGTGRNVFMHKPWLPNQ